GNGVLLGGARLRLCEEGLEAFGGEVRHRLTADVARLHAPGRIGLAPLAHEALGKTARLAGVGEHARLDLQQGLHRWLLRFVAWDRSIKRFTEPIKKRNNSRLFIEWIEHGRDRAAHHPRAVARLAGG